MNKFDSKMNKNEYKSSNIDIVLTWVDDSDPLWRKERDFWAKQCGLEYNEDFDVRYRSWDNLVYIFRGIEKFMPWVRKVHFITYGHLPKWLNTECEKLHIVNHKDFIPKEYLPTFNSNTIETNIFRIDGLAENYINFNDDIFVIKKTLPEDFFQNGIPCDTAAISPQPIYRDTIRNIEINNLKIINSHFTINDIKKNLFNWINIFLYGDLAIRTILFLQFKTIIGIFEPHLPASYCKSICKKVWDIEYNELHRACKNKFRTIADYNVWLFRMWQLLEGKFIPRSAKFGSMITCEDIDSLKKIIKNQSIKVVCINDGEKIQDFENNKKMINALLNELLPEYSSFELTI